MRGPAGHPQADHGRAGIAGLGGANPEGFGGDDALSPGGGWTGPGRAG